MILNELFKKSKKTIAEGGNLELPNPQDPTQPHQAQDIELKIHNRSYMVGILDQLMNDINNTFAARYKKSLWSPELLKNRTFLSGSSLHFFDVKNIPDEVFVAKKPKVGDIDTQCDVTQEPQVGEFLKSMQGQKIGNSTFIGFKPGNNQFSSLWALDEPPVKIQIDFEFGRYDPETNAPDEWYAYSHSSAWEDVDAGIKGVFHKYINRALTGVSATEKYVARVLKKGVKISPEPVTDNDLSFAVSGGQGGGMSRKYKPYVDPTTGEPQVINGIPVMQLLEPKDRDYVQNLSQQFELIYGAKPTAQDLKLMNSFVGTLQLANKYLNDQARDSVANNFIDICFGTGEQMINKDDPARDREAKFAAIDAMVETMKLPDAAATRQNAVAMSKAYEDAYRAKKGATPLAEAEVKAQLRKGMPHLRDLKPNDLLDLIDEIHDGNGQFKLENIPLNVKVDGFGGRFGKSADGRPFMGTSNTPPRYEAGFVKYHQAKGTTDPEVLARSQLFDNLFEEMMKAIKLVDNELGPDFLVNKQVTCEVLYLPFATETPEGKLKFVGIHYDKLPEGVQLALVPFRVVDATSGDDLPNANQVVKELTSIGQAGSVMFIDNSLLQNEALDVTAIVPPVENIEQIKSMLASGKLAQKREAKELLAPVALALEKAIINDPNIIGKDLLGKDYEGIVINSRLGPIKVTSQEQRNVISDKLAAKAAARAEQSRESTNKTAVVAIGSFVGHVGHEQLFDYTVKKAAEVGGDPYLFIGNAVGKDDPIPPDVKVQTWHKLYPEYSKNISATQSGGSLMQKIKHELINPLPGKPPRYDNVIIMVGEDQASMPIANALMKAVNKFPGYEHVKVSLEVTPRGTGMSFSKLRNVLKDPNATEQQQFALWSQAFDVNKLGADWVKHLMDITKKGMGIPQAPAPVAAPVAETRLLNALIRPGQVMEGTSIESTMRAIINDIGEPVTNVYDTMKFQAKKYMENHGELGRGFRMVAAGVGGRWVQNMYSDKLKNELYDLCRYNPRRTAELQDFLRGVESKGELDTKRSFGSIANGLPEILAKIGQHLNAPQLTKNAQRWIQNKQAYEQYIDELEAQGDNDYDEPAQVKTPKSTAVGQQNTQVDQIVNSVLSKLPSKIQGDIRNAIARAPNKLQALQAELAKRGVKAPMAENDVNELDVSKTLNFATKAHKGQQYGEKPYITHPRSVAATGKKFFGAAFTPDAIKVALLHDVVEDTPYKLNQLAKMGYSPEVVEAVQLLTKNKALSYADNIKAIIASGNKLAMMVKYADNYQNFTGDKSSWDPARVAHSQKKYLASLDMLGDKLGVKQHLSQPEEQGVAEGLNEFAPDSFNGGGDGDAFSPEIAKMAQEDGFTKGAGLADGATLERAITINHWHSQHGGMYKQYFAKGFKAGRMNKINHDNKQYNLNLKLMKDGSIRHGEQGVAESEQDPQSELKLINQKLKDAYKQVSNNSSASIGWYMSEVKALKARREELIKQLRQGVAEGEICKHCQVDPCICDDSHGFVNEERMSAAVRMQRAADKQRAKSDASLRRTPSSIPKAEPKKDEKVAEKMLPKSAFAGSNKNKLGPAGQWKNTGPSKNRAARAGDLVGGDAQESVDKKKGADGKACWKGYKYAGTENGKDKCVPMSENVENIMDSLINKIVVNEAIHNKK